MTHEYKESPDFTDDMPFGEVLRKTRRLMGMNQTDMGYLLGYNTNTISQWELGNTSPYIEDAREIIRRLGGCLKIEVNVDEVYRNSRNA